MMSLKALVVCLASTLWLTSVAFAQSTATLTLSRVNLTAGDTLMVAVTLDQAAPCDAQIIVAFGVNGVSSFAAGGPIRQGSKNATLKVDLPKDIPANEYRSIDGILYPCPGYSQIARFKVPEVVATVQALPPAFHLPSSATLSVSATTRQLLNTQIAGLDGLDGKLLAGLDRSSVDDRRLRTSLIGVLKEAEKALNLTESLYVQQAMNSQGRAPALFADFRRQYEDLITDLNAPIPGRSAMTADHSTGGLLLVQLVQRGTSEVDKQPRNLSSTYPPSVVASRNLLRDNKAAYEYIERTGRVTFDIAFKSVPSGARIRYKKLLDDDFSDWSAPTDVSRATLDLATWDFILHKDGCSDDQSRRISPYEDTQPEVSVEFSHCKSR